jgi:hypothetical protein
MSGGGGGGGNGEERVPKTWEWYGEAIKWFIAIAAALLAFGFERAADEKLVSWMWWAYLAGAALLGLSILSGLFAYLQLLGAASLRELPTLDTKKKTQYDGYVRRLGKAYQRCVGALALGVLSSSVAFIASIWPEVKTSVPASITVVDVDKSGVPLVVRRSGIKTEVLTSTTAGTFSWTVVSVPPSP